MGRICKEPELAQTSSGISYVKLRIACEQDYCEKGEDRKTDFLNVTAWRKDAMFISGNFHKGNMIFIEGKLSGNSYEKDNVKVYTTDITVTKARFTGERTNQHSQTNQAENSNPQPTDEETPPLEDDYIQEAFN